MRYMQTHRRWLYTQSLWITLLWAALVWALGAATLVANAADTPPIVGDWTGTIDPGAQTPKHIVVHISQEQDGTLTGTIDFPDQSMSSIPITAITFKQSVLHFESGSIQSVYDGTMNLEKSQIAGTLKQATATVSLIIKRTP